MGRNESGGEIQTPPVCVWTRTGRQSNCVLRLVRRSAEREAGSSQSEVGKAADAVVFSHIQAIMVRFVGSYAPQALECATF